jgi:hypothetical protein
VACQPEFRVATLLCSNRPSAASNNVGDAVHRDRANRPSRSLVLFPAIRGDHPRRDQHKTGVSMLTLQRWSSSPRRRAVMTNDEDDEPLDEDDENLGEQASCIPSPQRQGCLRDAVSCSLARRGPCTRAPHQPRDEADEHPESRDEEERGVEHEAALLHHRQRRHARERLRRDAVWVRSVEVERVELFALLARRGAVRGLDALPGRAVVREASQILAAGARRERTVIRRAVEPVALMKSGVEHHRTIGLVRSAQRAEWEVCASHRHEIEARALRIIGVDRDPDPLTDPQDLAIVLAIEARRAAAEIDAACAKVIEQRDRAPQDEYQDEHGEEGAPLHGVQRTRATSRQKKRLSAICAGSRAARQLLIVGHADGRGAAEKPRSVPLARRAVRTGAARTNEAPLRAARGILSGATGPVG